ncbi:Calx-beta domain-containing protein, partial [Salmonella sp. SAL4438]|uniref:Calx-beta domain-containing protein n=1 Tax=Salmonella sp. SAL4438 TaxID=3159893 RepID=UPI003979D2AD
MQFSTTDYRVGEAGGAVTVTVTRTGNTSTTAGVNYSTSNGTATAGADFTGVSGTLTFLPGETSKTFVIPVLD